MRTIAKFLLAVLSFAPVSVVAAPVSQTAGSNLTGYNGSMGSIVGNEWNTATNPRNNTKQPTAKADYGNCEAVILRCAKPKCSGGGCADINIAQPIVAGCLNSNATCKKFANDLMTPLAMQLVSASVAEQNKQAAAAAAAQSAADQNAQMMQQQMQQMQQQMMQMQQDNNNQIASLQSALMESQQATADAVAAAAQSAAANVITNTSTVVDAGTGLTEAQAAAAKSGVSPELIQRATISGQILTELEGVDSAMSQLKATMREAFRYGKCNEVNGDNCEGPKRVKKFRELAQKFFEPLDALEDNLSSALMKAQGVGVDLGNIYNYFNGTCNSWAEYICQNAPQLKYGYHCYENGKCAEWEGEGADKICIEKDIECTKDEGWVKCVNGVSVAGNGVKGGHDCYQGQIVPPSDLVACRQNRLLDPTSDEFSEKVLNPDNTDNATIRVDCSSDAMNLGFIKRRGSSKRGKGALDIDVLQFLITQNETGTKFGEQFRNTTCKGNPDSACYCGLGKNNTSQDKAITDLKTATVKKTLGDKACLTDFDNSEVVSCYSMDKDVAYVDPLYALCDTHAWNAGYGTNDDANKDSETKAKVKQIIGLKTTVITQQLYKQYTTLEKMIKQLKIMLEKETLKASLQVASGSSDESDSGESSASEFENCNKGTDDSTVLACIRSKLAQYEPYVSKGNRKTSVQKAMKADMDVLDIYVTPVNGDKGFTTTSCTNNMSAGGMKNCLKELQKGVRALEKQIKAEQNEANKKYIMLQG